MSVLPGIKHIDRKSTRLNSSHANISYAVFCLKKTAGFPTGTKWRFMPRTSTIQKSLVWHSDESQPGPCHDRDILRFNPLFFFEGLATRGYPPSSPAASSSI